MNAPQLYSVVTTIQAPTPAMRKLGTALRARQGRLLIVGDRKGPESFPVKGAELLSLSGQLRLPLALPRRLPVNHYSRKNLGYLVAMSRGAGVIYETDDDNQPCPGWEVRARSIQARQVRKPGWCNAYKYFSDDLVWPRGFPLDLITREARQKAPQGARLFPVQSPIQQGLVDLAPDVDAIWRLVLNKAAHFSPAPDLALRPGVWCPFNSQNTWWWPEAYPLMYLPSFCTFRMTDIWRSFVAQRCLWELGGALSFHASQVVQKRNAHNLIRDFEDEVPGYLSNKRICELLAQTPLEKGPESVTQNLFRCYQTLVQNELLPKDELALLKAWLADLKAIAAGLVL